MKKLIIMIVLIAAVGSQYVFAQRNLHEFSIYGGGGLSTLIYDLSVGDRNNGFGGDFGVGYTFSRSNEQVTSTGRIFRKNWGVYTGIGLGTYRAKAKLDVKNLTTYNLTDIENDDFDIKTTFTEYTEIQSAMCLNIPVMLQLQFRQFYFMGGFKFVVPVNANYSASDVSLTNEGYYPRYKNWTKTQTFAGFGKFEGQDYVDKIELGPNVMLALESGMKWRLNNGLSLFTGIYFDYGLSNAYHGSQKYFINYNPEDPEHFSTNSVLSLNADRVKLMGIGLKLRLTMER